MTIQHIDTPVPNRAEDNALLLTVEEAARRLRIGRTQMFHLLTTGVIESVLIGRLRRVPAESLTDYVATLRANCPAQRGAA
ncbi:excisionase family DNA-binding protein [Nonomuraea sp. bgisy101]|uniref:excisionase family DNA-binding protein n=1 Tax=Nonomuraea sp. bgisy101 TaxID=3413784 RepID=UPI003D731228